MRRWIWKSNKTSVKRKTEILFCVAYSRYFYTSIHRVINRLKNYFNLSWLRVRMSYHRFNNLSKLLNRDLAAKNRRGIFSKYLIDRKCNCSLSSKVNQKCVYERKFWSRCIIYEVKFSMCDDIYIGNTQQTFKKIMDGHFYNLLRLLTNEKTQTRLLPTPNSTLTLLHNVHIYVSIWRSK